MPAVQALRHQVILPCKLLDDGQLMSSAARTSQVANSVSVITSILAATQDLYDCLSEHCCTSMQQEAKFPADESREEQKCIHLLLEYFVVP